MSDELELFIRDLLGKVEEEAREILENAHKEADSIIKAAEEKARAEAERRAREVIDMERRRVLDTEMRRIKGEKAVLKDKILDNLQGKILKLIEEKIQERTKDIDYYGFLYKLVREAVLELGENEIVVSANTRDLEFIKSRSDDIRRKIREEIGIDVNLELGEKINVIGGIIVRNKGGDKVFNAVLDTLVKRVISRNIKRIVRRLGLISQNRFVKLLYTMFSKISDSIEIEASNGKKVLLHPCKNIYSLTTESGRIDLICEADNIETVIYATIGKATPRKIEEFINVVSSKLAGKEYQKIFIAFSDSDEEVKELLHEHDIALLTRRELFNIDRQVGSKIFE
ncbi:MAG: V-type ATP synthase subunit E family protein [Candidatus Korarchaeota archaeon]|nr:V-type ATP synthase subunit E family protein [Thermoproteota archaeon]